MHVSAHCGLEDVVDLSVLIHAAVTRGHSHTAPHPGYSLLTARAASAVLTRNENENAASYGIPRRHHSAFQANMSRPSHFVRIRDHGSGHCDRIGTPQPFDRANIPTKRGPGEGIIIWLWVELIITGLLQSIYYRRFRTESQYWRENESMNGSECETSLSVYGSLGITSGYYLDHTLPLILWERKMNKEDTTQSESLNCGKSFRLKV
ncbi:hypothetical protein C8F04DRAFT_1230592 [Mycena alexandri]|uniref:Uncharacterized protein n=1 Tax=Mycena alexandri TaxID=1745969 RepID=A0AAD6T863_9AGAR|nr:hypothetical protein C8F04DRAFT_1230592 [Mycena alexandri]